MKREKRIRRHRRIRKKIFGTPEKPRLSVFRTNRNLYLQIIDDTQGKTLVSANTLEFEKNLSNKEKLEKLAEVLVERALKNNIKKIVFDRGGFSYRGRIKILAEKLREKGLEF